MMPLCHGVRLHSETERILRDTEALIRKEFGRPNRQAVSMAKTAWKRGYMHPMARARYGDWARRLAARGVGIQGAIDIIELEFEVAAYHRVDTEILKEARLLLRCLRRYRPPSFADILHVLTLPIGQPVRLTAE